MTARQRRPRVRTTPAVPRVVLDTNVVLSALVFRSGAAAGLRAGWQGGLFKPLVSAATATELIRVLAYPKFKLDAAEQEELLADYLPLTEVVRVPEPAPVVPHCRDPHDLPFLHLAVAARADASVSGDADLLALSGQMRFPILTLAAFAATLVAIPPQRP